MKYKEYSQNLTFNITQTNRCTDGCYLLITYYSIYFSDKNSNRKIIGTEFTLLSILMEDENEIKSQIVNIPLNEHIFGIIDSSSHNIHYYSIFIPEKTNDIVLESDLNNKNNRLYITKGINKFNIYKIKYFIETSGNFTKNEIDLIGGQYFTFAVATNRNRDSNYYYFKISQANSTNNILIYPLDTSKETICDTIKINETYSCFLFIDNIYKDLYNDIIIYVYGNKKVNYTAWFEENNESNIYSIDIENLKNKKSITSNNTYLKINKKEYVNSKYIIIHIKYNQKERLNILTSYYDNLISFPSLQIFSYQLVYLNNNEEYTFKFDYSIHNQYRILINNTFGNGIICFNEDCSVNQSMISGKRTLSFIVQNETKNINKIKNINEVAVFIVKMEYGLFNPLIEELRFDSYSNNKFQDSFPIGFFLYDLHNNGVDINFFFKFNNSINDNTEIIINGGLIEYQRLRQNNNNLTIDRYLKINGRFDNRTNSGLIVFEKEMIGKELSSSLYNCITIKSNTEFYLEIHAFSKNDLNYLSIPFNKYISGRFSLKNQIQSQKYYFNFINDTQISDKEFIIEFSSNHENISLEFSDKISNYENNGSDGIFKKFVVEFNNNEDSENYFEVKLNNSIINNTEGYNMEYANYIIKFYPKSDEEDIKFELIHDNKDDIISKQSGNSTYILNFKINYNYEVIENYEFTYILNIYEKEEIFQNELINTIATIESKPIYSNITSNKKNITSLSYSLDFLTYKVEYEVSVFVIIQNKKIKEKKNYRSYNYTITKKNKKDSNNLIVTLIIITAIIFIAIPVLILISKYRNIMKKNKELEEKVKTISFSGENEYFEDNEDKKEKKEPKVSFI